jgi:membrane glycosyltransferase
MPVMPLRRAAFAAIALATAVGLAALLAAALAPGGWTVAKALIFVCFLGVVPWLGVCAGNALAGFLILLLARDPARFVLPVSADPDHGPIPAVVALAVTVRDEDMDLVLPPLRRLLDGLDAAGVGERFAVAILSDTQNAPRAAVEAAAIAAFRAADRDPARIRYRRRLRNDGFKAGNVMDFFDHHAAGFEAAIMLDADSEMSAEAVLRLLRILQAGPRLGIVQHLTVGLPAEAAFPRLFQFGMRAGMRVWATGQAWWQGDEGPYWGHNAALRIAPFRDHARLEPLPDGSPILSHDQVEAARLRAAGFGVCVWADEGGSSEKTPPTLPDFLARDSRWLAGNLQYFFLLPAPGFRPMGRWQLLQAILLFAGAPLYVAMLSLVSAAVALGETAEVQGARVAALAAAWALTLYAPKWLGYACVLLSRTERARYGGFWRFGLGALSEVVFTLLLDAPAQLSKTLAFARVLVGAAPGWAAQNRGERGVRWREAGRLFWPHTLFGIFVFVALGFGSWGAALWAAPFAGGLLTAIPFCVLTADPRVSGWLRRHRVAAVPEELVASAAHAPVKSRQA